MWLPEPYLMQQADCYELGIPKVVSLRHTVVLIHYYPAMMHKDLAPTKKKYTLSIFKRGYYKFIIVLIFIILQIDEWNA